jgi:hypothetical protein
MRVQRALLLDRREEIESVEEAEEADALSTTSAWQSHQMADVVPAKTLPVILRAHA